VALSGECEPTSEPPKSHVIVTHYSFDPLIAQQLQHSMCSSHRLGDAVHSRTLKHTTTWAYLLLNRITMTLKLSVE
jgi:hypothetical protein